MVNGFDDIMHPGYLNGFYARQQEPAEAIPTFSGTWNAVCRNAGGRIGLALGWHVMLAGAVNMGKSMMMLNLARDCSKVGYDAAILSEEMARDDIAYRLYPMISGIEADMMERGVITHDVFKEIGALLSAPHRDGTGPRLLVNDKPFRKLGLVVESMNRLLDDGVRVFMIDYLQLIRGVSGQDIRERVEEVSGEMFDFAHSNGVLTLGLSQFNRNVSREKTTEPVMEGMLGSQSLEADADQVAVLDHSRYEADLERPWISRTFLKIDKNRNGPKKVDVPIEWDWKTFRAREAFPDEEHLWPKGKGK